MLNSAVSIRFSELDKAALKELSARLQRNQSETLRVLVHETLAVLKEQGATPRETSSKPHNKRQGLIKS